MASMIKNIARQQTGQAATEFIIASVFLLVPLFILIPVIGKYIDIKHAGIQLARFESWEYTAWYGPSEQIMSGVKSTQRAAKKPYDEVRLEGMHFFFSNPNPHDNTYVEKPGTLALNPIWKDHRGESLFTTPVTAINDLGIQREEKTPDPFFNVLDIIIEVLNTISSLYGDLLLLVGVKGKFDALYTDGYFKSEVKLQVRGVEDILPPYGLGGPARQSAAVDPLQFDAKTAVLTNNWNSGGREHANQESRGLIMTSLLTPLSDTCNTILYELDKVANYMPVKLFELPYLPDFGYVADDLVPFEHIKDSEIKAEESNGLYYYQEGE